MLLFLHYRTYWKWSLQLSDWSSVTVYSCDPCLDSLNAFAMHTRLSCLRNNIFAAHVRTHAFRHHSVLPLTTAIYRCHSQVPPSSITVPTNSVPSQTHTQASLTSLPIFLPPLPRIHQINHPHAPRPHHPKPAHAGKLFLPCTACVLYRGELSSQFAESSDVAVYRAQEGGEDDVAGVLGLGL
jgi:hypothetical protein